MVIFCCLTVFWLSLTVFDEWYTVPIVQNTQNHWCTNRHRSTKTVPTVYQSSKTVKNSQKTVKTAQEWPLVYVPLVTCLHRKSASASAVRIHKAVCAYQQCCHLANGNKICPSLLVIKNNNMARGSQGFVGQSSRNSGTRVEQPSFFSELQYSAAFGHESKKFAGGVWKYAKFRHFLAHPVVTVL